MIPGEYQDDLDKNGNGICDISLITLILLFLSSLGLRSLYGDGL